MPKPNISGDARVSWRRRGLAALLLGLVVAGCGDAPRAPVQKPVERPVDPEARALHCYLVLTLTIDQLAEFDRPGRQGGVVAGRGADELLRARARHAAVLDDDLLDELRRNPWPSLEAMLAGFDADGDGQLATAAEVAAFNRHVEGCRGDGAGS
jgi:hypothetical protein